ncbi:hypothetical protein ACWCPQ_32730 [Nocardia sp. NPDC001965]
MDVENALRDLAEQPEVMYGLTVVAHISCGPWEITLPSVLFSTPIPEPLERARSGYASTFRAQQILLEPPHERR